MTERDQQEDLPLPGMDDGPAPPETPEVATADEADEAAEDTASEQPAGDELFDPVLLSLPEKRALLAALLFSSPEILPLVRLADFLGIAAEQFPLVIEETAGELRHLGLDVLHAAGGLRMVTAGNWAAYLARFHRQVRRAKLSRSALEILAVIAYEQPVSRARVDELRQVNSESTVRSLLDKRLITVAGRSEGPGRPFLYRTTERFLEVFGLNSLDDLPPRPATLDLPPPEALPETDSSRELFDIDHLPSMDDTLED
jgi:segregation and condensation protein B